MKKILALLALGVSLSFSAAHAADTPAPIKAPAVDTPASAPAMPASGQRKHHGGKHGQQGKMKACNADAGDKKGDERKDFMKECLKKAPEGKAEGKPMQQNKMKTCNVDAGDKKGAERKAFMKECLSAKKPEAAK